MHPMNGARDVARLYGQGHEVQGGSGPNLYGAAAKGIKRGGMIGFGIEISVQLGFQDSSGFAGRRVGPLAIGAGVTEGGREEFGFQPGGRRSTRNSSA